VNFGGKSRKTRRPPLRLEQHAFSYPLSTLLEKTQLRLAVAAKKKNMTRVFVEIKMNEPTIFAV
jgi:hypothetical protein